MASERNDSEPTATIVDGISRHRRHTHEWRSRWLCQGNRERTDHARDRCMQVGCLDDLRMPVQTLTRRYGLLGIEPQTDLETVSTFSLNRDWDFNFIIKCVLARRASCVGRTRFSRSSSARFVLVQTIKPRPVTLLVFATHKLTDHRMASLPEANCK